MKIWTIPFQDRMAVTVIAQAKHYVIRQGVLLRARAGDMLRLTHRTHDGVYVPIRDALCVLSLPIVIHPDRTVIAHLPIAGEEEEYFALGDGHETSAAYRTYYLPRENPFHGRLLHWT